MTFGADTTTDEVLEGKDLSGTWILVTGASIGPAIERWIAGGSYKDRTA